MEKVWSVARRCWFWFIAYGLTVFFLLYRVWQGVAKDRSSSELVDSLIFPAFLLWGVAFTHIFTTPIPSSPPDDLPDAQKAEARATYTKTRERQRRDWMIFSYSFMLLSLFATIYAFTAGWAGGTAGSGTSSKLRDPSSPIAVFVGCHEGGEVNELACPRSDPENAAAARPPGSKETRGAAAADKDARTPHPGFVLNIGGHVTNAQKCSTSGGEACRVSGGLLVPLYVIILALMGGSISLTRRLPEYQVRANPEYIATEKDSRLTQHQFREYLVFQIVQYLSAPLIAVLAYYLVAPDKLVTSVALAFTAGFASESILIMVRSVTEKITPALAAEPKFGTVTGTVTLEGKPLARAEVQLAAYSQVRSVTDASGHFMLSNVPIGEHQISVVYQQAEDPQKGQKAGKFRKSEMVRIERAQQVVSKSVDVKQTDFTP